MIQGLGVVIATLGGYFLDAQPGRRGMKRPVRAHLHHSRDAARLGGSGAGAHIVASRLGDFYTGALHPLTDLQDLILWVAMGVLAGSLGASRGRWLVLLFPLGLLAGLSLAPVSGTVSAQLADATMILAIGMLLAAAAQVPTLVLCAIAFAVAVIRGAANGAELGPETDRLLFAAGLVCVGYGAIR